MTSDEGGWLEWTVTRAWSERGELGLRWLEERAEGRTEDRFEGFDVNSTLEPDRRRKAGEGEGEERVWSRLGSEGGLPRFTGYSFGSSAKGWPTRSGVDLNPRLEVREGEDWRFEDWMVTEWVEPLLRCSSGVDRGWIELEKVKYTGLSSLKIKNWLIINSHREIVPKGECAYIQTGIWAQLTTTITRTYRDFEWGDKSFRTASEGVRTRVTTGWSEWGLVDWSGCLGMFWGSRPTVTEIGELMCMFELDRELDWLRSGKGE